MKKHKHIDFCHLHMHSKYSELDAISKVPDMVKRLSEYGHKAACISEHGTIASIPANFPLGDNHIFHCLRNN